MGLLAQLFLSIRNNKPIDHKRRSSSIFYKLVESMENEALYKLQCINTNAIFYAKINDIVLDTDILHGLHPIQACYIGIEYAKFLKSAPCHSSPQTSRKKILNQCNINRYGNNSLRYEDRHGNICFIKKSTQEELIMDPRDIALTEELINEFDAAQAFHIGFLAGLKMNHVTNKHSQIAQAKYPHLKIIK